MAVYTPNTSNVVIGGAGTSASTISIAGSGAGQVYTVNGSGSATWTNPNANTNISGRLKLNGKDADIEVNGVSMLDILNGITDRLAILQPKPELLEKYENLREAYEHYKTLEALLHEETTPEK